MRITSILQEISVIPNLHSHEKSEVLQELSDAIVNTDPSINSKELCKILMEREELGSTGIGSGVAIPHGKLPNISHMVAAFGRSVSGIDFDSQDGKAAHLFFAMVAPENSAGIHLKALAKLSRLLKNNQFRQRLLDANSAEEIYRIIAEEDERLESEV